MNIGAYLPRMRALAESRFEDKFTVREKTGETFDDDTGKSTPVYVVHHLAIDGRIQQRTDFPTVTEGERTVTVIRLEVQFPIDIVGLEVDWQVVVLDTTYDDDLIDRVFRIAALHHKTHATARRLMIEEVVT